MISKSTKSTPLIKSPGKTRAKEVTAAPAQSPRVQLAASRSLLLVASFIMVLVGYFQVLGRVQSNESWTLLVTLTVGVWLCVYVYSTYVQFRSVYLLTTAYIFPLCVFHFGAVIPDAIGWFEVPGWSDGPLAAWLGRAGWYTAIALGSIGIGFALSLSSARMSAMRKAVAPAVARNSLQLAYWAGTGLLVASMVFLIMGIHSVGNLLEISRTDIFVGVGDSRGLGAFISVFPGAVILMVIGAQTRKQKIFAWFIAGISFVVVTLSGYRTQAFYPVLIGMVIWVKSGRRVPTMLAVGTVAMILFLIPIIGTLRAVDAYKDINLNTIGAATEGAQIERGLMEMGSSLGVAAHVFRIVPDQDPYRYGTTYLVSLKEAIPNIGTSQGESIVARVRRSGIMDPDMISQMPPASWITYRVDPIRFKVGGGIGFSAVAEPYLNFGPAGVAGFFIILGFLLGKLEQKNLLMHPKTLVLTAAVFWALAQTVRNTLGGFIKPAAFVVICLFIWYLATRVWKKKQVAG